MWNLTACECEFNMTSETKLCAAGCSWETTTSPAVYVIKAAKGVWVNIMVGKVELMIFTVYEKKTTEVITEASVTIYNILYSETYI